MKKDIALHFGSMLVFFLLVSLFRKWLDPMFWPFWLGGIIGTIMPDIDHLIYVYGLRPHDLSSQRVVRAVSTTHLKDSLSLLYRTRAERTHLIIHNSLFQVLFVVFAFLMVGSRNLLAVGIVLAFLLHLLMDQLLDFIERGTIRSWFEGYPTISKNGEVFYWLAMLLLLVFYGFLF